MSGAAKAAKRAGEPPAPEIDRFRGQHLALAERQIATEFGRAHVTVDESESPLAWLARRRGRNGRALIVSQAYFFVPARAKSIGPPSPPTIAPIGRKV